VQLKIFTDDLGYGAVPSEPYTPQVFALVWKNVVEQYIREYKYMGTVADMTFEILLPMESI
jgi:hypothetical protein